MASIIKGFLFTLMGSVGVKCKLSLLPINDLKIEGDRWVSTGSDPSFFVEGRIIRGWNQLIWYSEADEWIQLKMYWDNGEGFSENRTQIIGGISKASSIQKIFCYIPKDAVSVRLDPGEKETTFAFRDLKIRKVSRLSILVRAVKRFINQRGFAGMLPLMKKTFVLVKSGNLKSLWFKAKRVLEVDNSSISMNYHKWLEIRTGMDKTKTQKLDDLSTFGYLPLISIILPVYNVEEEWLRKCIDSVRNQLYANWELCISDDASTKKHIKRVLDEYKNMDSRIKVIYRSENGHISRSSNTALTLATGEFIGLLDHDDELTEDALYENVLLMNNIHNADVIYSDEDKITIQGERFAPFFKPDWSPDLLTSQMYTCHFTIYRKSLVDKVGGFRTGYEGSQDYDLMLRVTELTRSIHHIPKILYHWRAIPSSTASSGSSKSYTHLAGLKALEDAVVRRKWLATVESIEDHPNVYHLKFEPKGNPKVSIIIPTRNMATILSNCLESIFLKTEYQNFEVIVIDNGSTEQAIFDLYDYWGQKEGHRFKTYQYDIPFNYSKINNYGAEVASGELLLLLNNDIEVISNNWLDDMVGQAIRPEIGAVGACLYYPDFTIQHAGVILGIGGIAGHSHKYFSSDDGGYYSRLKAITNYAAVTAACLMIRKDVFMEVGGLEEQLEVAFNDVDFCLKVYSKGYYNVWLPQVKLIHYESKSRGQEDTPEKKERFRKEIEWMKNRWGDLLDNDPFYNPNLSKTTEDFSLGLQRIN
ncbi:glycosyltransferase family 2 protein [Gorillibacterium timonense]|uniref:glycosyltransferase family 2 protein n=1 Tax=Gorillibacterium timonense TaxID=1689269 RepID=UPI000A92210D|nr:glycosyltransferase family 2 protein [Gorillibacterium timonense]